MSDQHHTAPVSLAERRRIFQTPQQFQAANPDLVSLTKLYQDVRANRIPHVRLGRKVLIPSDAFDQMLAGQTGNAVDHEAA